MGKILVIDDSDDYREYLMTLLRRDRYEVDSLPNGFGVAARIKEGDVDAVITDLYMPGADGFETISAVKQQQPELPVIAVIGTSNSSDDCYLHLMKLLGAAAVLVKPVDETALLDIVRRLVSPRPYPHQDIAHACARET